MKKKEVDLFALIHETVERMNRNRFYRRMGSRMMQGQIQKMFEIEFLDTLNAHFNNSFYHPNDVLGISDIVNTTNPKIDYEIKCTFGWNSTINGKPSHCVRWQHSTVRSGNRNFLFLYFGYDNNRIYVKGAWYGEDMPFEKWTLKCKEGMRIGLKQVEESCKRII